MALSRNKMEEKCRLTRLNNKLDQRAKFWRKTRRWKAFQKTIRQINFRHNKSFFSKIPKFIAFFSLRCTEWRARRRIDKYSTRSRPRMSETGKIQNVEFCKKKRFWFRKKIKLSRLSREELARMFWCQSQVPLETSESTSTLRCERACLSSAQ